MKNFCTDLREHATKIINSEKKNDTNNKWRKKLYQKHKVYYICKKGFSIVDKKYQTVRDHCHYAIKYTGAAPGICNSRYKTLKEVPVIFHNDSTYDYKLIIKELAKEFDGPF